MALSKFKKRSALFNHFVLMLLALSIILPILILFFNSLKPQSELLTNPLGAPMTLRFTNYYDAFVFGNYSRIMLNSLYFVVGTLVVCLPLSALASFSLAILSPRGKLTTSIAVYLLIGLSIPAQLYILPLFILWKNLYLTNTYIGLIIIYSALNAPFAVFLMRSYMIQLPKELFEAAKVDGASTFELFYKIAIPLSWPVFLTSGLIVGLAVWNEFLFAVTFIQDENFKPISTILFSFSDKYAHDYSLISAASIMMAAPIGILFILFQRNFIAGLTSGGLKG
jgi:raffinose/stachyose/melibiose transport system permease protein|tara:strand:+ start:3235 stop:4077 length:843 start_codon:yes stop_codon:yes gene_type:complete